MKRIRALAGAGLGLTAYALYEPYRFRLTYKQVPVATDFPLTVLHLSDMHLHRRSSRLTTWLERLPDSLGHPPDIVVCTGDMIEDNEGIEAAIATLNGFPARFGRFYVLGSHDYYVSEFKPYTRYFETSTSPGTTRKADTPRLRDGLERNGWIPLLNTFHVLETPYGKLRFAGVDDPYLKRHRTEHIERSADESLAIALVHSPDVVSEWILAGYDLVLAGHTHAGQVRLPILGAVVTNCSLPSDLAGGLNRVGAGWLHVSPGLGTGKFAPIRLGCRPEATLLELQPEEAVK